MNRADIEVVGGGGPDAVWRSADFCAQWSALHAQCPWATAFGSPGYVTTWYTVYGDRFQPVLVVARDSLSDQLAGVLALAVSDSGGRLVVAGDVQAEYQSWTARPELGDWFAFEAIAALRRMFPRAAITLNNMPESAPRAWIGERELEGVCLVRSERRPLLRFEDGKQIAASLAKRGNKSRMRQLEKLGGLELVRVTDPPAMRELFEAILPFHDARHMAMRGAAPFMTDTHMKRFGLALLEVPGLIHATVLKAGGLIASAHFGACGKREVELGLIAHNPRLAKFSPGKFHILLLALMLMREGYEQLDLTPGGDLYKERFANAWDQVYRVRIYPTRLARRGGGAREVVKGAVKRTLGAVGLTTNRARLWAARMRRARPLALAKRAVCGAGAWVNSRREIRLYEYRGDPGEAGAADADLSIRRDAWDDLLAWPEGRGRMSRQVFLATAQERAEELDHVYTHAVDGRLLHYAWVIERPDDKRVESLVPGFSLLPGTVLLSDFYTVEEARRRGLATRALRAIAREVLARGEVERVRVAVDAGNPWAIRAVEKAGFVYAQSVIQVRKVGRVRSWTEPESREGIDRTAAVAPGD
jgi:CelD/BcsL family acetyltransferase involved in cellulose biosynthesis/RimJ/RimL family protein N-acetyltransferase